MTRRSLTQPDVRHPPTWWKVLRAALLVVFAFPVASFGTYRLFLYLYLPPAKNATTPLDVVRIRQQSNDSSVVIDDSCRRCSAEELKTVRLCVQSDGAAFIGHAFVRTPEYSVGFRTNERDIGLVDYLWPWAAHHPGYIRNDEESPYDFELTYKACPETMEALRRSIYDHALSPYQVGNWRGGRNCATWAADRIRDAGLVAPLGDCPNRMARRMRSAVGPVVSISREGHQVVMQVNP